MATPKRETPVEVVNAGREIIIPDGMSPDTAIMWLQRRMEADAKVVKITEETSAFMFDGALAFAKALARRYGWTNLVPTPGFFGENPPQFLAVEVAPGEIVQVPWGRVEVPGIAGYLEPGRVMRDGRPVFVLHATVRAKFKGEVAAIAADVRAIAAAESIYRGKALKLEIDDDGDLSAPKFLDLGNVDPAALILPADVQRLVDVALFTPLTRTVDCRRFGIPLKRGILLEGPYGTGKTLTAYVSAKLATDNGWTFCYLPDVRQLAAAITFAKMYGPAVIFAEDIDRAMTGERSSEIDDILNTIDGIDAKSSEIMVVLTTNHVERLNRAMLRPGRLDAVIPIHAPDADAVARLIGLYGRGLVSPDADLSGPSAKLAGQIPAVVREVVERAKLAAVGRGLVGSDIVLLASDLDQAAESMLAHLHLMREAVPVDSLAVAIGKVGAALLAPAADVSAKLAEEVGSLAVTVDEMPDRIAEAVADRMS